VKIELNKSLDTGQLLDLENHLIEKSEEAYLTERPDLDQLAVRSGIEIQNEELGAELISFLELNIPRIIIWKDGVKVADKFGNSPFDLESMKPKDAVNKLLEDDEGLMIHEFMAALEQLLKTRPDIRLADANILSPENVAELTFSIGGKSKTVHVDASSVPYFCWPMTDGEYQTGNEFDAKDAADFLLQLSK
jgi:hypothetical protein